jgi:hypothetical protein
LAADRCVSTPPRWFCTARASIGTESSNHSDRFAAKTILETIGEANSRRGGDTAPMTSPRRNYVQTSEAM